MLKLSSCLEKLARIADLTVSQFINAALPQGLPTIQQAANQVAEALKELDPNDADPTIKPANYALLDILMHGLNEKVDDAFLQRLMGAAGGALSAIRTKAPNDTEKNRAARYLVSLLSMLMDAKSREDREKQNEEQESKDESQSSTLSSSDNPVRLLIRLYRAFRSGATPSQSDRQSFSQFNTAFRRRLQGLSALSNRTPAQEQERKVIQTVMNWMTRAQ